MHRLHPCISLPIGYHITLPELHYFPLSQPIPKAPKQKERTRKNEKKTMRNLKKYDTAKKWHYHAFDVMKTANQAQQIAKYQKHNTRNKYHNSIPMVPNASKGNPT